MRRYWEGEGADDSEDELLVVRVKRARLQRPRGQTKRARIHPTGGQGSLGGIDVADSAPDGSGLGSDPHGSSWASDPQGSSLASDPHGADGIGSFPAISGGAAHGGASMPRVLTSVDPVHPDTAPTCSIPSSAGPADFSPPPSAGSADFSPWPTPELAAIAAKMRHEGRGKVRHPRAEWSIVGVQVLSGDGRGVKSEDENRQVRCGVRSEDENRQVRSGEKCGVRREAKAWSQLFLRFPSLSPSVSLSFSPSLSPPPLPATCAPEDILLTALMTDGAQRSWASIADHLPHARTPHGVRNRWLRLSILNDSTGQAEAIAEVGPASMQ